MSCKTDEEREFYLTLSVKNRYSFRELKRQMDSALFERTMMSDITNKLITERSEGLAALRDSYVLEFLDLPDKHKEKDLRKAIVKNLKNFILEFGSLLSARNTASKSATATSTLIYYSATANCTALLR
jgi:predicted nuclease of restriction endonuclease-like (RecB) superfamily